MSPILIVLLCLYPLVGWAGLIAFVHAARRTSEDWENHPAIRGMELALQRVEEQPLRETKKPGLPSRASQM
jgi:hypothetical protein